MRLPCVHVFGTIPTLKPEYAELIIELELWDGDPARLASQLGITRNNLKVRRHRARRALRKRLEEIAAAVLVHGSSGLSLPAWERSESTTGQESSG
jgi:RNA polymerase sigma-70 factor (ECF subfamily)